MKIILALALLILTTQCSEKQTETSVHAKTDTTATGLRYAEGFKVSYRGTIKMVEVGMPYPGARAGFKYLLVPKGESVPKDTEGARVIRIPLESIVCTSTSHIPLLDYLGETDKLTGFPSTDYISSDKVRARIDSGRVLDLGVDKSMNLERLVVLKPEVVMGYTMTSDYGQFKKMEELGVSVVINAEYLEKHPLGRAEWIKFMALFFNKEHQADSIFNVIEESYLETMRLAQSATKKPTVLSGIVYGDAWFMPGGQNYASRILKDAGCTYLWEDDPSHGFLELSFESVFEKAHAADLWIGVGSNKTIAELQALDHRYTKFNPLIQRHVYTSDARHGAKGGSEFLELGYLRPDIILKDLVRIAHPELSPNHELYFHKRLD
ncbi:MAG: ABC transporter substrate-binding protein [Chryseolinea sp.]